MERANDDSLLCIMLENIVRGGGGDRMKWNHCCWEEEETETRKEFKKADTLARKDKEIETCSSHFLSWSFYQQKFPLQKCLQN